MKTPGFPVLGGPYWARLPKVNDLDNDFLVSRADPMLRSHPDYAGTLARMEVREFATPLLTCTVSLV